MMLEEFVFFLLIGKLVMFLARKAPYKNWIPFLAKLFDCELCLGVWVYFCLSLVLHEHIRLSFSYIPIVSEFLTGAISSFIVWLLTDGWNSKFRVLYLE